MERYIGDRREVGQFTNEALNRKYRVMAVDPYSLEVDTTDPQNPEVKLGSYSQDMTNFVAEIYRLGIVDKIILFGDASFGKDYPSTGGLMAKQLIEEEGVPIEKIIVFGEDDQNQTSTQVKRLAKYLKGVGLEGEKVLYPVWGYHQDRVENHASSDRPFGILPAGYGVNVVTLPIEDVYHEVVGVDNSDLFDRLPLDEAEKKEELRKKISRYDKKGIVPRMLKPFTGSITIYNEQDENGNLVLIHKSGQKRLKEVGLA